MAYLPFDSGKKYLAGNFKCNSCEHETIIFINEDYSLMNVMVENKVCCVCNEIKELLTEGDLILRYDEFNPDTPPWQLQYSHIEDRHRICKDCFDKDISNNDWKKLRIYCTRCEGFMNARDW